MGSRVTRVMGILPAKFELATPLRSGLIESGTGQTDRETDRQRLSMHYAATVWGAERHNKPIS